MAINLTTKYSDKIAERFSVNSITDAYAGKDYEFSGVKSIKIYSIDTVPVVDYTRSGQGRFGTLTELGDTIQELTMTQDKSFTFSIDQGNAVDQLNIKQVNRALKRNWDEVVTPMIDLYRFTVWSEGAGLGTTGSLTASNIVKAVMTATRDMSNAFVPLKNRTLFVKESLYIDVKLANELIAIDTLGAKSVSKGVVGYLDGMPVVRVPDSFFPDGLNFLVKYKSATVDPMKLKVLRVQRDPLGIDGDVGECRFYHDSFVLDTKKNGIYAHTAA